MRKRQHRGSSISRSITKGYLQSGEHPYGNDWETDIRPRVLLRDNYTCRECFIRLPPPFQKYLHVHHESRFVKSGNNSMLNLKTLCVDCHSEEHGKSLGRIPDKVKKLFKR